MATYNKYTPAVDSIVKAGNVATDTWKLALALTVNAADSSFVAGTTDLATGGGYTQGGQTATTSSSTTTGGVMKLILTSPGAWTASGGGFTFRYVILYNSTTGVPVGYWDNGSNIVMNGTNGDTFTVTLDAGNGVFQVS